MHISEKRRISLALLLGWTILCTFAQLHLPYTHHGAYLPTFLYFVVPTIHLLWWYRINIKKILLGSLLIGVLIPLSFDLLVHVNGSWFVPFDKLLIPYKFLGFYPVDELIWFYLLALYTLVFYEVFVDNEKILRISRNYRKAAILWGIAILITLIAILTIREHLIVRYSYFSIFIPFSLPPILYVLVKKPLLLKKFLLPTMFFFFVALNFEVVGLTFGDWEFNSEYIGWFSAFGRFFPFEELFYWIFLYPATALSYYELLVDDGK